ncbi:MAG TPA: ThiF family adenylyltransferase [Solimonas sp.]
MNSMRTLAIQAHHHEVVRQHLFPGDGLEAAAILLCESGAAPRRRFLVKDVLLVPHDECVRKPDALTWPGSWINRAIDQAEDSALTVILIHSHPGDYFGFSLADDWSDQFSIPSLLEAFGEEHGTAVMTSNGAIIARTYTRGMRCVPVDLVTMADQDIHFWWHPRIEPSPDNHRPMAFASGMTDELNRLTAVVIGASGTGSITVEQTARLGFGRIIVIDFDRIERKNLNRILNSSIRDAQQNRLKVSVMADAIKEHRENCEVIQIPKSIKTREAVLAAAQGDVIFSCVDSLEGRMVADLIGSAFLIPLLDVGVVIPTRRTPSGGHAVGDVLGQVNYVFPGGSTLEDRGIYTAQGLRAEELRRVDRKAFETERAAGYFTGFGEEAPAVISLNMRAASACINEFIARAYPFRIDPNSKYARTVFSLAAGEEEFSPEETFTRSENPSLATGAREPLLGLPILGLEATKCAA